LGEFGRIKERNEQKAVLGIILYGGKSPTIIVNDYDWGYADENSALISNLADTTCSFRFGLSKRAQRA
jgi:hypothetical protein